MSAYPDLDPDYGEITKLTVLTLLFLTWPTLLIYFYVQDIHFSFELCMKFYTLPFLIGVYIWALVTSE